MKPIRINTGDLIQNLKWYMFITNEYGKPSKDSLDTFIESFRDNILIHTIPIELVRKHDIKTFSMTGYQESLDNWWDEVKNDLTDRGLDCIANYRGGFEWLSRLSKKALNKEFNSEEDIKNYIENSEIVKDVKKYSSNICTDTVEKHVDINNNQYMVHSDIDGNIVIANMNNEEQTKLIDLDTLKNKFPNYVYINDLFKDMMEEFVLTFNSTEVLIFTSDGNVECNKMYTSLLDYIATLQLTEQEIQEELEKATFCFNGKQESIAVLFKGV